MQSPMAEHHSTDLTVKLDGRICNRVMTQLDGLIEKFPKTYDDETHRHALNSICVNLSVMEIKNLKDGNMISLLRQMNCLLKHFSNADAIKPLNLIDYRLFIRLVSIFASIKNVIITMDFMETYEIVLENNLIDTTLEEYLVNSFKTKLDSFKVNCSNDDVKVTNTLFTIFLLGYLKFLSKSEDKMVLNNNIDLLLEVADPEFLLLNYHKIVFFISKTKKKSILQKIVTFCIECNYPLQKSQLLLSVDIDFKLELVILSYFTLQHLCTYLEIHNLKQSSQILSKTPFNRITSSDDPINLNNMDLENSEESLKLRAYKYVKPVPSNEIKKCLVVLETIFYSTKKYNSGLPFTTTLLCMLYEFVMATDLDKSCIMSLINVVTGTLGKVPSNFKAGTYALKIYKKLKTDFDLELKAEQLFEKLSIHAQPPDIKQYIIKDLEQFMCNEKYVIDVSVIASRFLKDSVMDKNELVNSFFYAFNESVIQATQKTPGNYILLFPYSVALSWSLETKNEDCLFDNLAVLMEYVTVLMDENQIIPVDYKKAFLSIITDYYKDIVHVLPNEFLDKCLEFTISPSGMNLPLFKRLLSISSSKTFSKFIEFLKLETTKLIEDNASSLEDEYYAFINEVWLSLLNMQTFLTRENKKIRKDLVNHYCFILNRTFLFNKNKVPTEQGLMVLIKIVCSFLRVPWINTTALMNCSLRIVSFVERNDISRVAVLTEATELLIVLYKCPNNSIKPHLGLYMITFVNILKKCCSFVKNVEQLNNTNLGAPFHKLEKCSSLFKENKNDFVFINRYVVESLLEVISIRNSLPNYLMRYCEIIVYNLLDVCSEQEIKYLMLTVHGQSLQTLKEVYRDYMKHYRYNGRL